MPFEKRRNARPARALSAENHRFVIGSDRTPCRSSCSGHVIAPCENSLSEVTRAGGWASPTANDCPIGPYPNKFRPAKGQDLLPVVTGKVPRGPIGLALTFSGWWALGLMSKPPTATPLVPDEVLLQLAGLARIPAEEREEFYDFVREGVQTAWELNELANSGRAWNKSGALVRAAKAALNLYEELANLKQKERDWVQKILDQSQGLLGEEVLKLRGTAYQLATLLNLAIGKPPSVVVPGPHQAGRKSSAVKNPNFQNFVFQLLIYTRTSEGNLSLEKNIGRGTLLSAVELLAPYLPEGFERNSLSMSTYQRLKDSLSETEKTAEKLDRHWSDDQS
jgi:hypothetical protein